MMNPGPKTPVSKGHFPVGLEMTYDGVPTAPAHRPRIQQPSSNDQRSVYLVRHPRPPPPPGQVG